MIGGDKVFPLASVSVILHLDPQGVAETRTIVPGVMVQEDSGRGSAQFRRGPAKGER